jgi:penicillin-binding protein 2
MANLAAIIANRGYYYIPHVIKGVAGEESIDEKYLEPHYVNVEARHFEPIINGMWRSVNVDGAGTSRLAYLPGLDVCGKTGTAQNPAGKDHSNFISFAPANNPKIAISVYVEHGGWGSSVAVPIASLIEELYLTDTIMRPALVEKVKNLKINYAKSRDYRPKDSKKAKKK